MMCDIAIKPIQTNVPDDILMQENNCAIILKSNSKVRENSNLVTNKDQMNQNCGAYVWLSASRLDKKFGLLFKI